MAQSPVAELTEAYVHDKITYNGKCLAINRDYKTRGRKLQAGRGDRVQEALLLLRASLPDHAGAHGARVGLWKPPLGLPFVSSCPLVILKLDLYAGDGRTRNYSSGRPADRHPLADFTR